MNGLGADTGGAAAAEACVCGHDRPLHRHYRAGSDCATCGPEVCARFRPRSGRLRGWLRRLGSGSRG